MLSAECCVVCVVCGEGCVICAVSSVCVLSGVYCEW